MRPEVHYETDATAEPVFGLADNLPTTFPYSTVSTWIMTNSDMIAQEILDRIENLPQNRHRIRPDIETSKSLRDIRFHLSYLAEALIHQDATLFLDYIEWVKVLFKGLDIGDEALLVTLQSTSAVIKKHVEQAGWTLVDDLLRQGIERLDVAPDTIDSFIQAEMPLSSLSNRYLDALLAGQRRVAHEIVMDAMASGKATVRELYLHVFQRSQYEIGRLWQTNKVSVAQEHYCTAATQLIMSQLYPYIFTSKRINRQMIAASIGGELHELGIRMVADFFEMEGWDTHYLGANTPEATILETVAEKKPDLLAISATITYNVRSVAQLIAALRKDANTKQIKILVGGYPFNASPTLWQQIGADGFAPDAEAATVRAAELVGLNPDAANGSPGTRQTV